MIISHLHAYISETVIKGSGQTGQLGAEHNLLPLEECRPFVEKCIASTTLDKYVVNKTFLLVFDNILFGIFGRWLWIAYIQSMRNIYPALRICIEVHRLFCSLKLQRCIMLFDSGFFNWVWGIVYVVLRVDKHRSWCFYIMAIIYQWGFPDDLSKSCHWKSPCYVPGTLPTPQKKTFRRNTR